MGVKAAPKTSKALKDDILEQKSPAEFFADNRNIAGFDNPGKCLYTTIRELVENALDAAESIHVLPDIDITIEEMSQHALNHMRGISNPDRIDEALYHDFESDAARVKRLQREAKELDRLEKLAAKKGETGDALDGKRRDLEARQAAAQGGRSDKVFYRVTIKDNGAGMAHAQIPDMLGRVLSGTKYGVAQTRGKFGLGAKMALIWSKMSTGLPITIRSARPRSATISYYKLDIDIQKNQPNVHEQKLLDNLDHWHGAELSLIIAGNWQYYRSKVLKYLQLIAVITPYTQFYNPSDAVQFNFKYVAEEEKQSLNIVFARRTDVMASPPKIIKHHPASVDLELIKRLAAASKDATLLAFLSKSFACVSRELSGSGRILDEMQAGVSADMTPAELGDTQLVRLHQLLHEVKFPDPSGNHLSPAGEYNLRLGIMKEFGPDLVATHQGEARVHDGHAFLVEAGVSLGGSTVKPGINIHRFANRIPLLFEVGHWGWGGSDVITRTALKRINWALYKINQATDRVGVFVSIVSTKIPFKGAGKEYIADDVEEMQAAVKSALQACCLQLRSKLVKQAAAREQAQRKRALTKYVPNVAAAVYAIVQGIAARPGKRPRLAPPEKDVIDKVASGDVTQKTLATRLMEHIERFDTDMVGVVSKGKNKTRRYTARMGTTLYLFHLRLLLACQDTNPYTSTPPPIPV
ncbi:DNA topoisomerase 6 subunit B [Auxenochlorella protothecoides]|uniref:DNA topoisomerase 6 subunit B n=1 Tax=Auxenochlorella protothecoides TaxID=3075 RepID=A0A087SRN8_AUXPR|nr:DNA topoisomerase 6 subunit B [Auxenochlorella protothecoides]KFM28392.1 DNA topoisomerase 6 subunit B [Auxenochlorella protothecoides]